MTSKDLEDGSTSNMDGGLSIGCRGPGLGGSTGECQEGKGLEEKPPYDMVYQHWYISL